MLADGGPSQEHLAKALDFISGMHPIKGHAAAYICVHHTCKEPTSDIKKFESLLASK